MRQGLIPHLVVALAAVLAICGPVGAQPPTLTFAEMRAHPADPREPGPNDFSLLIRNEGGMAVHVETSNLDQAAYTTWWVIFNFPEFCRTTPCGPADIPSNGGDPAVRFSEVFADGHFVTVSGRAFSDAGLSVGETKDVVEGPGLLNPFGAEVFLVLKSHGPVLLDQAHLQITTTSGGCPPNDCSNQQFSIHLP